MSRSVPSDAEASALRKIADVRSRVISTMLAGAAVTLSARLIPNVGVQVGLVACAVIAVVGCALYLSFGMRCPRCSSWIPPAPSAKSRCTSCGMNLHPNASVNPSVESRQ